LPLALLFADADISTAIYDTNKDRITKIRSGIMPFDEEGADSILPKVLQNGRLILSDAPDILAQCQKLILIIGTPVDEHLNPQFSSVIHALDEIRPYFRAGQVMILRSTLFPGLTAFLNRWLKDAGIDLPLAFCPERVAQGFSLREFRTLPQIVSGTSPFALEQAKSLFSRFAPELIEMEPEEAEFAKLITNSWRYLQFAIVNQFYMLATENGLDFSRILNACQHNYPRMAGVPGPGFAAGPCLVKDTMQLAAYSRNTFHLGHAGMLVNEGLPYHLIAMLEQRIKQPLHHLTTAILGMAFKGNSDDRRDSLSYKLKKLLQIKSKKVLCSDPFVRDDPELVQESEAIANADIIFIGAPHSCYRTLTIPNEKEVVDIWNILTGEQKRNSTE
jgi:UDP-N-acetyl-D-mannosaminuronic acid dehydrogenase